MWQTPLPTGGRRGPRRGRASPEIICCTESPGLSLPSRRKLSIPPDCLPLGTDPGNQMWHHMRPSFPLQVLESQSSPPYQTSLTLQREKLRPRGMELPSWPKSNPGELPRISLAFLFQRTAACPRHLPTARPSTMSARPNSLQSRHPVTFYKVFDQKENKSFFFKWP